MGLELLKTTSNSCTQKPFATSSLVDKTGVTTQTVKERCRFSMYKCAFWWWPCIFIILVRFHANSSQNTHIYKAVERRKIVCVCRNHNGAFNRTKHCRSPHLKNQLRKHSQIRMHHHFDWRWKEITFGLNMEFYELIDNNWITVES